MSKKKKTLQIIQTLHLVLFREKDVLRQAYYKYARKDGHHPESYRVFKTLYERHIEGKHVPFQRYFIPLKNEKRLKTIKGYLLILEPLYKMHADQNVFLCLTT